MILAARAGEKAGVGYTMIRTVEAAYAVDSFGDPVGTVVGCSRGR